MAKTKYLINGNEQKDFDWVKIQLINFYNDGYLNNSDLQREMICKSMQDGTCDDSTYIFSLKGSPPKCTAIYLKSRQLLIMVNVYGEVKKLNYVRIKI